MKVNWENICAVEKKKQYSVNSNILKYLRHFDSSFTSNILCWRDILVDILFDVLDYFSLSKVPNFTTLSWKLDFSWIFKDFSVFSEGIKQIDWNNMSHTR